MSENREEILANFQSITSIDDVTEAIYHLEESNWDLHIAIQRVMPLEHPPPPPLQQSLETIDVDLYTPNNLSFVTDDVIMTAPTSPSKNLNNTRNFHRNIQDAATEFNMLGFDSDFLEGPSTSSLGSGNGELKNEHYSKSLDFIIRNKKNMYKITMPANSTVHDLKIKIQDSTFIPICHQLLKGWAPTFMNKDLNTPDINSTPLRLLTSSKETDLVLTNLSDEGFMSDDLSPMVSNRPGEYKLYVEFLDDHKIHALQFDGDKTLSNIKQAIFDITEIPVRNQVWTGWPSNMSYNTTLDESGIESEHHLTVKRASNESNSINENLDPAIEIDSDEEFVDANDEDDFTAEPQRHNQCFLIPDQIESERLGSEEFVRNYSNRFTDRPHPEFFIGSLEEAYHTACLKPAKERKLLALYLHHDDSVLTNVFCSELLGCELILQTLSHNFVLFGWDLTFESNKNLLLSSISACIGPSIAMNVRNIPVTKLPTILIIAKCRGSCDILSAIDGNVGVDELSTQLIESVELFTEQQKNEIRDENERAEREQIKYEQDRAFQESLEADRLKEMKKLQQEQKIANERKRLESEKAEIEAKNTATRMAAEITLPPEPTETGTEVTKIRITKPEGDFIERKFTTNTKLQILLNFIVSKGFFLEEYKLIAFPRLDLTSENPEKTLKSLNLYPQVTVRLEQR